LRTARSTGANADGAPDGESVADDPANDDADDLRNDDTADATPNDADPAVSTSAWIDGGADCERCGERISRGWFDDGALCCADCMEW
jgi:hypothetical protein